MSNQDTISSTQVKKRRPGIKRLFDTASNEFAMVGKSKIAIGKDGFYIRDAYNLTKFRKYWHWYLLSTPWGSEIRPFVEIIYRGIPWLANCVTGTLYSLENGYPKECDTLHVDTSKELKKPIKRRRKAVSLLNYRLVSDISDLGSEDPLLFE